MRKVLFFAALFGALGGVAFAQTSVETETLATEAEAETEAPVEEVEESTEAATTRTGFRSERSFFEFGIVGAEIGASNSWLSIGELFDMGHFNSAGLLDRGEFAFELGIFAKPLNLKISLGSLFTLRVNVGVDADLRFGTTEGTMTTIKNMLGFIDNIGNLFNTSSDVIEINDTLSQINSLRAGLTVEGEAFGVLDILGERTFLQDKLWLKAGPSVFLPVLYIPRQSIGLEGYASSINNKDELLGKKIGVHSTGTGIDAWTAFIDGGSPGVGIDLSLEGRYAFLPILDAGAAISGIPLVPAFMDHKRSFKLEMDYSVQFPGEQDLINGDVGELLTTNLDYGFNDAASEKKAVLRPIRFNFYGIYKPLKSSFLLVIPEVGFSIKYPGSDFSYTTFNWGVNAQINLPIILSVQAGIRRFEEVWSNSVGFILNFRAFELDLGVALRGPTFSSSWSAKGLNALVGFKFGW
ncbi:MAG: hypothetical protein LBT01_02525 [Spirochaetaceae bacterium]|jgi:hypothetical protein|nr:hypothetical protein [Spirochaetaceae bacterium]